MNSRLVARSALPMGAITVVASMAASVLGVFAPIVILSIVTGHFVNAWLWAAFLAMNVMRAATLGWRYASLTRRGHRSVHSS